jgi:hypothetical protein
LLLSSLLTRLSGSRISVTDSALKNTLEQQSSELEPMTNDESRISLTRFSAMTEQIQFALFSIFLFSFSPQNLLHSTIEPLPEYKTQSLKKSRFILSHYGVFKGFWDWLILSSTFYVAFVVPYNAAFVQTDRLTMASDVIVEALFILGKLASGISITKSHHLCPYHSRYSS